jgi:hypothetical protein
MGWYNLVKELQDSGVEAICVFDGKERSAAKAREVCISTCFEREESGLMMCVVRAPARGEGACGGAGFY